VGICIAWRGREWQKRKGELRQIRKLPNRKIRFPRKEKKRGGSQRGESKDERAIEPFQKERNLKKKTLSEGRYGSARLQGRGSPRKK